MKRLSKLRLSPALVVALTALVAAMSGAAIALPGKNSVKKNDIANGAVTGKKIAEAAVKSKHIKGKSIKGNRLKDKTIKAKQIADNAIGSTQVAENGLNTSDLSDVKLLAAGPVAAVDGTDEAAAVAAAPKTQLFKKGQLTVYGKCVRDETADIVYANIYIETSANGAIVDGDDELSGDPAYLDTDTAEEDREVEEDTDAGLDSTNASEGEFMAIAPDGTRLVGLVTSAAKNGNPAEGNGVYGAGNVCLFGGQVSG